MTIDPSVSKDVLEEQYGEGYFGRVYRTSVLVFVIGAAMVYSGIGMPGLIGLAYGAAISLVSLRAIEWIVRHLLRPELHLDRARVTAVMVLKLPILGIVLSGAAWLVVHNIANVFALVSGLGLVQAVIVMKAVGALLVSALPSETTSARASAWWTAEAWRAAAAAVRQRSEAADGAGTRARHGHPEALPAPD